MPPESAPAAIRTINPLPRRQPAAADPRLFGRAPFTSRGPSVIVGSAPAGVLHSPDPGAFLRALGKRVRLLRLACELTQADLAEAAAMSRSFISQVEHGVHGIDIVRLLRIAAVLGLPLTELIDLDLTAGDARHGH